MPREMIATKSFTEFPVCDETHWTGRIRQFRGRRRRATNAEKKVRALHRVCWTGTDRTHRKLPTLSASLTLPTPVDDPAQHQGRLRTVPHVEGQYATYIYVPLVLHPSDALYTLIEDALAVARTHLPALHAIGKQERDQDTAARWSLHISLSRPLYLRAHQRDEFKRAIKEMASSIALCVPIASRAYTRNDPFGREQLRCVIYYLFRTDQR